MGFQGKQKQKNKKTKKQKTKNEEKRSKLDDFWKVALHEAFSTAIRSVGSAKREESWSQTYFCLEKEKTFLQSKTCFLDQKSKKKKDVFSNFWKIPYPWGVIRLSSKLVCCIAPNMRIRGSKPICVHKFKKKS